MMRKYWIMIMAAAAMAFTSCDKAVTETIAKNNDNGDVKVTFNIELEGATRAVKTQWAVGDQVIAFIDDNIDADQQVIFTYGEDGWEYEVGSALVFHNTTGLVQAGHVGGTLEYDSANKEIKSNGSVALVSSKSSQYTYNFTTKELNISTITLSYKNQFQVTVPNIKADEGYYLMIAGGADVELQGYEGRYHFKPKSSALAFDNVSDGKAINVTAHESGSLSLSINQGLAQIAGLQAEDGCVYTASLASTAATAEQYHFFLGTYFNHADEPQLWEYVVDKTDAKTLKAGSAIILPPLSEWKVVFESRKIDAQVSISNPFPGFGDPAKSAWAAGDKLNIWSNFVPSDDPQVVLEYDGEKWNVSSWEDALEFSERGVTALYEGHNDPAGEFYRNSGRGGDGKRKVWYSKKPDDIYAYASKLTAYGNGKASLENDVFKLTLADWKLMTPLKVIVKNAPDAHVAMEVLVNPHISTDKGDDSEVYRYFDYDDLSSTVLYVFQITESRASSSFSYENSYMDAGAVAEGDNKVFYFGSVDTSNKIASFTLRLADENKYWILDKPAMKVRAGQAAMTVVELDYNDASARILSE